MRGRVKVRLAIDLELPFEEQHLDSDLSPSHAGKVKPPKVRYSRGSIKSTVNVKGIPKSKGDMSVSW